MARGWLVALAFVGRARDAAVDPRSLEPPTLEFGLVSVAIGEERFRGGFRPDSVVAIRSERADGPPFTWWPPCFAPIGRRLGILSRRARSCWSASPEPASQEASLEPRASPTRR